MGHWKNYYMYHSTFLADVLSRSASFKMSCISFLSCSLLISAMAGLKSGNKQLQISHSWMPMKMTVLARKKNFQTEHLLNTTSGILDFKHSIIIHTQAFQLAGLGWRTQQFIFQQLVLAVDNAQNLKWTFHALYVRRPLASIFSGLFWTFNIWEHGCGHGF